MLSFLSAHKTQDDVIIDTYQLMLVGKTEDDNEHDNDTSPIPHPPVVVSLNEIVKDTLRVSIYIEIDPEQLDMLSVGDIRKGEMDTNECGTDGFVLITSRETCMMAADLLQLYKGPSPFNAEDYCEGCGCYDIVD